MHLFKAGIHEVQRLISTGLRDIADIHNWIKDERIIPPAALTDTICGSLVHRKA